MLNPNSQLMYGTVASGSALEGSSFPLSSGCIIGEKMIKINHYSM